MNHGYKLLLPMVVMLLGACDNGQGGGSPKSRAFAGVLYGPIVDARESYSEWIWGDSSNALCQMWSIAVWGQRGWFYGRKYPWSTVDVFVLESTIDPLSINAAENFDYTSDTVSANVGDTVFFKGRNGYYGAWTITAIDGTPDEDATLSGIWYFRPGGGGDFTRELAPGSTPIRDGFCANL